MSVIGWRTQLRWDQFREVDSAPDGSGRSARTETSLAMPGGRLVPEGGQFRLPAFNLTVSLIRRDTWVIRGRQTAELLVHEQGHWDIAGLVAWELHRALEALRAPSRQTLVREMQSAHRRLSDKLSRLNTQYDAAHETNHGNNATAQTRWTALIESCIRNNFAALPSPS